MSIIEVDTAFVFAIMRLLICSQKILGWCKAFIITEALSGSYGGLSTAALFLSSCGKSPCELKNCCVICHGEQRLGQWKEPEFRCWLLFLLVLRHLRPCDPVVKMWITAWALERGGEMIHKRHLAQCYHTERRSSGYPFVAVSTASQSFKSSSRTLNGYDPFLQVLILSTFPLYIAW